MTHNRLRSNHTSNINPFWYVNKLETCYITDPPTYHDPLSHDYLTHACLNISWENLNSESACLWILLSMPDMHNKHPSILLHSGPLSKLPKCTCISLFFVTLEYPLKQHGGHETNNKIYLSLIISIINVILFNVIVADGQHKWNAD